MSETGDEVVREDSPWTYPLIIVGLTLILSGAVAYYYFGPTLSDIRGDTPQASDRDAPIHMQIGGANFIISENYTQFPRARRGGSRDSISLYALLPGFEPYSIRNDQAFFQNEVDNPVIYFTIETERLPMTEVERVDMIYRDRIANPEGLDTGFGLTQHTFEPGSSYGDEDLFLGEDMNGNLIALMCTQLSNMVPSPNCRRETELPDGLRMTYRFKRAHLEDWYEIDAGLQRRIEAFRAPQE